MTEWQLYVYRNRVNYFQSIREKAWKYEHLLLRLSASRTVVGRGQSDLKTEPDYGAQKRWLRVVWTHNNTNGIFRHFPSKWKIKTYEDKMRLTIHGGIQTIISDTYETIITLIELCAELFEWYVRWGIWDVELSLFQLSSISSNMTEPLIPVQHNKHTVK